MLTCVLYMRLWSLQVFHEMFFMLFTPSGFLIMKKLIYGLFMLHGWVGCSTHSQVAFWYQEFHVNWSSILGWYCIPVWQKWVHASLDWTWVLCIWLKAVCEFMEWTKYPWVVWLSWMSYKMFNCPLLNWVSCIHIILFNYGTIDSILGMNYVFLDWIWIGLN